MFVWTLGADLAACTEPGEPDRDPLLGEELDALGAVYRTCTALFDRVLETLDGVERGVSTPGWKVMLVDMKGL